MSVFRALALAALVLCAPLAAQVVIDNVDAGFSVTFGSWTPASSATGKYGSDYRYKGCVGAGSSPTGTVEWRPSLAADTYTVEVWYPAGSNRANDAPFTVHHANGSTTVRLNQQVNGGQWVSLGSFDFNAGTGGYLELANNAQTGQVVIADAARFTPVSAVTSPDEFRGLWVSRFEWPSTTPSTWKANLNNIMANARAGNFNAVVLQMRGDTTTLYPSPHEPLSSLISNGTGDDALAYAINAAHALGLELHCYFNTHVCTSAFASAHQSWLIADATGTPISSPVDGYYWLAPGHPDVQAYLRTQVMHIVNTYPTLDGIHFDRIRMPEPVYSHDSISEARRTGGANPDALNFDDWTADQITRWLRDVYAEVHGVNPNLQLSAAPLGLYAASAYAGYPSGYYYGLPRHQDAKAWLAQGALDWIAPQCYWADGGSLPDFSDLVPDWQASASGRHVYPGMSSTSDANETETVNEITAARNFSCKGTMVWSYGSANSLNFWANLSAAGKPYEQPASTPDLPWLSNPTTAIVKGVITDFATGQPLQDVWVTRAGDTYTALSAADGFWCWLNLPPGNHTFTADLPGTGTAIFTVNGLSAGEVRTVNIAIAPAGTATRLELDAATPTSVQTGGGFDMTVRVVDSLGTTVTAGSYNLSVSPVGVTGTLTGATAGATVNGEHTFTFSHDAPGTIIFVVAESGGTLAFTTTSVTFTATQSGGGEDDSGCAIAANHQTPWWLLTLPLLLLATRLAPTILSGRDR
jgi:uncharacterized lipoprotein YddW (UPF0748 family)